MARVNGRMPGDKRVWPACRGGYGCCDSPIAHENNKRGLREELTLAAEETDESFHSNNFQYENLTDPDWDGKLSDYIPEDVENIPGVTFKDARGNIYGQ